MKDKRCVCVPILLMAAAVGLASESANDIKGGDFDGYNHESKLERIVAMWNRSAENGHDGSSLREKHSTSGSDFATEFSKCIEDRQYQITENISRGKAIILNCFKTTLTLNLLRYMGESPRSKIKLFNGVLEFDRIGEDCEDASDECGNKYGRRFEGSSKREQYMQMYEKAMLRLMSERNRLNAYRNHTDKEKVLSRIRENSEAFLSEVIGSIGNDEAEREEEERIKKELTDPKLLSVLNEVSKNYFLKLRFYPGVAARMMRSHNGGFTFDLELNDLPEEEQEEGEDTQQETDEESTREIKGGPQSKDFDDDDDDDDDEDDNSIGIKKKKGKGAKKQKKKQKQMKKKAKQMKKIVHYLLIPLLIQMALLPFVFKKLFFLAMKALLAGKLALLLVGFNVLRNTCIKKDDDFQKIRVEHYGYKAGEEYGAWVNGRSLQESLIMSALGNDAFEERTPPVTS